MAKSKDTASKFDMTPLGEGYEPTNFDVVCARGRIAVNHTGNKRFKLIVESSLQRYSNAPSKLAKSAIVSDIVDTIRKSSPDGGFVKKEGNMWYEAGDHRKYCIFCYSTVQSVIRSLVVFCCCRGEMKWVVSHTIYVSTYLPTYSMPSTLYNSGPGKRGSGLAGHAAQQVPIEYQSQKVESQGQTIDAG